MACRFSRQRTLTLLNAPAAQAQDTGITVSDIVINKGKPIVVGTSKVVEPSLTFGTTRSPSSTGEPCRRTWPVPWTT
ncbi:hypothetical protein ABZ258_25185 [Streptomyces canus]